MNRNFGGVIWTNHALDRMRERGVKQGDAWATFNRPEQSRKGASDNWVYYRNWGGEQIEVVAKQNERKQWLILSVWSRPTHGKSQKAPSFWSLIFGKLFPK